MNQVIVTIMLIAAFALLGGWCVSYVLPQRHAVAPSDQVWVEYCLWEGELHTLRLENIGLPPEQFRRFARDTADQRSASFDRSRTRNTLPAPDVAFRPVALSESTFPLWPWGLALLLYPSIALARREVRRIERRISGRCEFCGYDATGNMSGFCSECGRALAGVGRDERSQKRITIMNREEFIARVKETAYLTGTFKLRSGRISNYYLDKYRFETQPDILAYLGAAFAEFVGPQTTRIAGAELGGVALAAAASMAANLPFVIVRNAKKGYGTDKPFEGVIADGDRVLIVEDIATTGGQVLEAARMLTESGCQVERIVAVIDRQEGARENIEGAGFVFNALLTSADLGITPNQQ